MHGLITEIQSLGVRVDRHIAERKGGAGPADGRAFVIDGKVAMVPLSGFYVDRSPYFLQEDDQGYLLLKNERPVARPEIVREPAFYGLSADDGVPFRKIALLHGRDCLATTVLQRCVHWKTHKRCAFCATETSLEKNATVAVKTPAQLAQAAAAAYEMDGITHIVLTSGTGDPPGSEIPYLAECTRAVKASVELPVQVQFAPPEDLSLMDVLLDAGVDSVGIHVESFDADVLESVAPAKAQIGIPRYVEAWRRAVELFGPNQVSSFIIAGLGESPESVAWGCEFLADLGVYPFVVPLRPIPGSRLQDKTPPPPGRMKRIYESAADILRKKGLSARATHAGCVRCSACCGLDLYECSLRKDAGTDEPDLVCHSARTDEEREHAFRIRNEVFVKEQGIFAESDRDESDRDGTHLVAKMRGKVVGTVRVFRDPSGEDRWIGGRLAVAAEARKTRAGSLLVKEAMKRVKKNGCRFFTAHIQEKNIRFFKRLGWTPVGEIEDHYGMPHLKMEADLGLVPEDLH